MDGNGNTDWTLTVNVNWCYDGTYITYYYRWVVPQAVNGNWCDLGTVSDSVSSPTTGYTVTQSYHKHHFAQCIPSPWGMTYWGDTYPWVEADVYGNGGYASNAGT